MAEYLGVEEAEQCSGLRLVLTAGVPGPWGESAKGIFHAKKIPYVKVRQSGGQVNEELRAWTGHDNAPQAVWNDEPARTGWTEILMLAERIAPEPALLPEDAADRAMVFGLSSELCGEGGFGWMRRLLLFDPIMKLPEEPPNPMREMVARMASKYGYGEAAVARASSRAASILRLFSDRLAAQKAAGRDYLVGDSLTAVDIYWAAFAALVEPLPHELCPMPEMLRASYSMLTDEVVAALDPALLAHRDRVYERHLELPIDL